MPHVGRNITACSISLHHTCFTYTTCSWKKNTSVFCCCFFCLFLQVQHSLSTSFRNLYLLLAGENLCWHAWPQLRGGCAPADSAKWADIENSWKCCTAVSQTVLTHWYSCLAQGLCLVGGLKLDCLVYQSGFTAKQPRSHSTHSIL